MFLVIFSIANNVIVRTILPNIRAVFLITKSLECRYKPRWNGILYRRGRRSLQCAKEYIVFLLCISLKIQRCYYYNLPLLIALSFCFFVLPFSSLTHSFFRRGRGVHWSIRRRLYSPPRFWRVVPYRRGYNIGGRRIRFHPRNPRGL